MKGVQAEHPTARMQEILDGAARVFYRYGYHACTLDDVAQEVGISKPALYHYIDSKEDLLYRLFLDTLQLGRSLMDSAIRGAKGPAERLEAAVKGTVEHVIRNQVRVGLTINEVEALSEARRNVVKQQIREYEDFFLNIIKEGQAAGVFVHDDPEIMLQFLMGSLAWVHRWCQPEHADKIARIQKTFTRLVLRGYLREGASGS